MICFRAVAIISLSLVVSLAHSSTSKAATELEDLERRVTEIESGVQSSSSSNWSDHIRLGGSANTGYYEGRKNSVLDDVGFEIWDVRLFVDAELGSEVRAGETTLVRNTGVSFEWNLIRLGREYNEVGELFIEFQGIGDCDLMNIQFGRFQIPVGENYLRFSKGYSDNPFITNTVGGTWYWDEGVKFYGNESSGELSYVASITDAENKFNTDTGAGLQYTLKLIADPSSWLHLSVSGVYTGKVGDKDDTEGHTRFAGNALWLGESWARAFGASTDVPNVIKGEVRADAPNIIDQIYFVGADVVIDLSESVRLWLSYGLWDIEQEGSTYDRELHQWIAEILLEGSLVATSLSDVYLGLRANGLGTYDNDEGFLTDFRYGSTLGWNVESQTAYSVVVGWKMLRSVTLRAEYTRTEIDLVKGVGSTIRSQSTGIDSGGLEVGVHF